jgi:hypothetical protein
MVYTGAQIFHIALGKFHQGELDVAGGQYHFPHRLLGDEHARTPGARAARKIRSPFVGAAVPVCAVGDIFSQAWIVYADIPRHTPGGVKQDENPGFYLSLGRCGSSHKNAARNSECRNNPTPDATIIIFSHLFPPKGIAPDGTMDDRILKNWFG